MQDKKTILKSSSFSLEENQHHKSYTHTAYKENINISLANTENNKDQNITLDESEKDSKITYEFRDRYYSIFYSIYIH
jgi:hypothetical protein